MYFSSVVVTQPRWDQRGQQRAPRMSILTDYKWSVSPHQYLWTFSWKVSTGLLFGFFVADTHITPVPIIYSDLWVSCNTTCKSEGGVFKAISPEQKKKSPMLTRTRQAYYVQTMQRCLQSCALFHSLHPTPSGLADLPSCSKIIC